MHMHRFGMCRRYRGQIEQKRRGRFDRPRVSANGRCNQAPKRGSEVYLTIALWRKVPMNRFQFCFAACVAAMLTFTSLPSAQSAFHLWKIDEVYSNASGTVQFIELDASINGGQQFTANQTLESNGHTFSFGPTGNLPSDTTNKKFILATPGYFALTGVPTADFNLGVNNFFSTTADTINYASGINTL